MQQLTGLMCSHLVASAEIGADVSDVLPTGQVYLSAVAVVAAANGWADIDWVHPLLRN